jgi:hypothetical protein
MVLNVSFRHACGHFDPAALAAGFSLDLAMTGLFRQSLAPRSAETFVVGWALVQAAAEECGDGAVDALPRNAQP